MELKDVLLKRRSIRNFQDKVIEKSKIDNLLHSAMSGPSACNRQPWYFYVITNKEKLIELRQASPFTNHAAPLAIVVCGDLEKTLPKDMADYWIQDCSAATENILLSVVDEGLGAVWCGVHPQVKATENVKRILELKDTLIPLNIIWIGYPNEERRERDYYDSKLIEYVE